MKNFVILEENRFEDTAPALAGLSFRHRREANRFPEGAGRQQSLQIPNWARKTVSDCGRRWRNQYLRRNSSWWWRLARRASSPWVLWFSPCFFFPSSGSPPWRGSTLAVPPVQSFVGLLQASHVSFHLSSQNRTGFFFLYRTPRVSPCCHKPVAALFSLPRHPPCLGGSRLAFSSLTPLLIPSSSPLPSQIPSHRGFLFIFSKKLIT